MARIGHESFSFAFIGGHRRGIGVASAWHRRGIGVASAEIGVP